MSLLELTIDTSNAINGLIVAALGVIGYFISNRVTKAGSRENALIDQLQEERKELRSQVEEIQKSLFVTQKDIQDLQAQVLQLKSRDMIWHFHTSALEVQVQKLGGTPIERPNTLKKELL